MDDDIVVNMNFNLGKDQTVADIVTLLRKYQPYSKLHGQAADEIERLRLESLQLQGLVRAHEGMYVRAAEQIDQLRAEIRQKDEAIAELRTQLRRLRDEYRRFAEGEL